MKPLYRTLDVYIHKTCRDLGWIIVLCYIRAAISVLSLMNTVMIYDGNTYDVLNMLFTVALNISVLVVCHMRKRWGVKVIRVLFGIPFCLNVIFLLEAIITLDSYLVSYNLSYVLLSGLVFLFTMKSVRLSYFFLCTKNASQEDGIPYSFGSKSYIPYYNFLILYHAIESHTFDFVKYDKHMSPKRIMSKMCHSINIFNAYLSVACASLNDSQLIEDILIYREILMKTCRWYKSAIEINEDSFVSCTYALRKSYSSNGNINIAIQSLSYTLTSSGLHVNTNELSAALIGFYHEIRNSDFYEDYYNNQLLRNAALYIN